MRDLWDRIGISTSILCVVHCLFTPLLVLSMPVVGEFLSHDMFHVIIILIVVPVAVWALWNGYRLHRLQQVLWLGGFGIVGIVLAMILGANDARIEIALMILSGLTLASAHYFNLRACRIKH